MKKKVIIIIAILLVITSIGLFLYPTISNQVEKGIIDEKIGNFDTQVENVIDDGTSYEEEHKQGKVDEEGYQVDTEGNRTSNTPVYYKVDLDRLYKDSVAYNDGLKENQFYQLVDENSYVNPAVDLTKYGIFDGIYGYISAPSIGMELPIYLGANDYNMCSGAGHMTYTSLPIGGKSTNCVLTAHTGYIGRTFFDNLGSLNKGDKVYIKNFWGTLEYKVILKEVHTPKDSYRCYIEEGKDLLTLITCVSDGNWGFNRYYVICERV